MPLNQYAVEIENGRTGSENGMVIEGHAVEIENGRTGSENGMVIEGQQDLEGNLTVGNQHTLQSNHGR